MDEWLRRGLEAEGISTEQKDKQQTLLCDFVIQNIIHSLSLLQVQKMKYEVCWGLKDWIRQQCQDLFSQLRMQGQLAKCFIRNC